MKKPGAVYEVEFRCHFESRDEACRFLPFLPQGLQRRCTWETAIHGLEYFRSGLLLRTATVVDGDGPRYFIGRKGPDLGKFANIRQEVDGEIGSPEARAILGYFGSKSAPDNLAEVVHELEQLGYPLFMSFKGEDSSGYYQPLDVHLKLMTCRQLQWPLVVEIEKTAGSPDQAARCEEDLLVLCRQFSLQDRVIREEPPTLLYQAVFRQDS